MAAVEETPSTDTACATPQDTSERPSLSASKENASSEILLQEPTTEYRGLRIGLRPGVSANFFAAVAAANDVITYIRAATLDDAVNRVAADYPRWVVDGLLTREPASVPVDGIPWEIHAIEDPSARASAIAAWHEVRRDHGSST